MRPGVRKERLLSQMAAYFPERWDVSHLESRLQGDRVVGAIKIHCRKDDKTFLSDFTMRLDTKGKIQELTLDGVAVNRFVRQLHEN